MYWIITEIFPCSMVIEQRGVPGAGEMRIVARLYAGETVGMRLP